MENCESSYRRFLAGDEAAFDEILDACKDSLIFFLCRYVKSVAIAEEIAADTFALLIVILVVKPTGLFGEKATDKV